jgi:hypothetical protein
MIQYVFHKYYDYEVNLYRRIMLIQKRRTSKKSQYISYSGVSKRNFEYEVLRG